MTALAVPVPGAAAHRPLKASLIIPAHDEQDRIQATLERYHAALTFAFAAFEIIVVANGCRDATVARARVTAERLRRIVVCDLAEPLGKGGAVLAGFGLARGERVAFADADGATSERSLVALLRALDDADVAVGSRKLRQSVIKRRQPLNRRVLSACFSTAVHALFDLDVRDTQCGAKAFRAATAQAVAPAVKEGGWAFDVDLLLTARRAGARIVEFPVEWADQPGSRLHVGPAAVDVSWSLWRIRRSCAHGEVLEVALDARRTPA